MLCTIITGDAALNGLEKTVEDFTASSDTLSFTNNVWPKQVGSGLTFELTEPGIWSANDLRKFIESSANRFLRLASDLGVNYAVEETIGAVTGVVDLPANVLKFVDPQIKIDGKVAAIISPDRASQLDDDPFINPTTGEPIGHFLGRSSASTDVGRFKFKPATNASVIFNFIPIASFDNNGAWKVPEEAWEAIQYLAVSEALLANERPDLSGQWERKALMYLPKQKDMRKEEDATE